MFYTVYFEIIPVLKGMVPLSEFLENFTLSLAKDWCYLPWNKHLIDLMNLTFFMRTETVSSLYYTELASSKEEL